MQCCSDKGRCCPWSLVFFLSAWSLLNFVEDLQKTIKIVPHFAEDTNQVLSSVSVVRLFTFLQRLQNWKHFECFFVTSEQVIIWHIMCSLTFFTDLVCEILLRFTNWCFPVTKQQVNSWHIPHNLASQPKAIVVDKRKDGVYQIWNIECKIPTQTQHQNKT